MVATAVVLVQHAAKVRLPGDPGLTERGRRQADRVALALTGRRPAALISSPLLRARQTASPLAAATGLAVEVDARLRERTNWERGQDPDEFFSDWRRSTRDRSWHPEGERSSNDTAADMLAALDAHLSAGRTVVLVGHGGATTDLLRTLLGDDALEALRPGIIECGPPSGALTRLERIESTWSARSIADVAHLEPDG